MTMSEFGGVNTEKNIRLQIGQDFRPFEGIEDLSSLRDGETPDVLGRSEPFYLDGIGEGEIVLIDCEAHIHSNWAEGANLLDLSGEQARAFTIHADLAGIVVGINHTDKSSLPDIVCLLNVKGLQLKGEYTVFDSGDPEACILFYNFSLNEGKPSDVIIPLIASDLAQLSFRFERKSRTELAENLRRTVILGSEATPESNLGKDSGQARMTK